MRRALTIVLSLVMLFGLIAVGGVATIAQEATPDTDEMGPPDSFELAPGVLADGVVFVEGQENPALYRLHIDAGVVYPVAPSTSLELVYMEAGSLTVRLDGAVTIGQIGEMEEAAESIPANMDFTLEQGQFAVLQPGVSGAIQNEGQETAVLSVAGLTPGGAVDAMATPAG